jgi:hypothetical protein
VQKDNYLATITRHVSSSNVFVQQCVASFCFTPRLPNIRIVQQPEVPEIAVSLNSPPTVNTDVRPELSSAQRCDLPIVIRLGLDFFRRLPATVVRRRKSEDY